MSLVQLVYTSNLSLGQFSNTYEILEELQILLDQARVRNRKISVTGILLFGGGEFLQVLEGHHLVVNRLFDTIKEDPRLSNVDLLACYEIRARTFEKWFMGLLNLDQHCEYDRSIFREFKEQLTSGTTNFMAQQAALSLLNQFLNSVDAESEPVTI